MDQAKNFAKVTVSDGNYDASATSVVLIGGDGGKLPAVPFNVVWWNATDYPDPADDPAVEIVRVTARSTDTLTVTRAQEGTGANDKNVAGKTYKMIAGVTRRTITDMIGDVFSLTGPYVYVDPAVVGVDVNGLLITVGDKEGAGVGTNMTIDNSANLISFMGELGTDQTVSASGPVGTVVAKLPIKNLAGTLIGYIPIYGTIT